MSALFLRTIFPIFFGRPGETTPCHGPKFGMIGKGKPPPALERLLGIGLIVIRNSLAIAPFQIFQRRYEWKGVKLVGYSEKRFFTDAVLLVL